MTNDNAEVERLRIALADAMNASHTLTADELIEWAGQLREHFERMASRRYRQNLLATGYAMGQSHGFTNPVVPLPSLSRFADAVVEEDVEIPGFQALYERMARGESTQTHLPSAA